MLFLTVPLRGETSELITRHPRPAAERIGGFLGIKIKSDAGKKERKKRDLGKKAENRLTVGHRDFCQPKKHVGVRLRVPRVMFSGHHRNAPP